MRTARNVFATALASLLASGCGGGNGGADETSPLADPPSGTPSPIVKMEADDLLNLYPTFYLTMVGLDSMIFSTQLMGIPIFGDSLGPCQTGSVTSTQTAPGTYLVNYLDCLQDDVVEVPGVPRLEVHRVDRGMITYTLLSKGGDFDGARQDFSVDFTTEFDHYEQDIQIRFGTDAPTSVRNVLNGTNRITYTGANLVRGRGTQDYRSEYFEFRSESTGPEWSAEVSDTHTIWELAPDGVFRKANINLRMSAGPYSDKDLLLNNIRPAWLPYATPDLTITTTEGTASIFANARGGIDRMSYGVSRVYIVYAPDGLTLELDLDGNNCLESKAVISSQRLHEAIFNDAPLTRDLLAPYTSCVAPPA